MVKSTSGIPYSSVNSPPKIEGLKIKKITKEPGSIPGSFLLVLILKFIFNFGTAVHAMDRRGLLLQNINLPYRYERAVIHLADGFKT